MLNLLYLFSGIILLTLGGESLIRGALAAANRFKISPLLSGLVIVGFGTSAPEMVVSVNAAIDGQPDIAIGNVVGSNIGNILLILGICALITPLTVKPLILKRDATAVVAATVLFLFLAAGGMIERFDGIILILALSAYLIFAYWSERFQASPSGTLHKEEFKEISIGVKSLWWIILAVGIGLLLLIIGSQLLLVGAVAIAKYYSVPEGLIGLTLVAVGTSLPELTISIIAALRKHADVAVGNILGSNIFNILGILGVSAFLQPLPISNRVLNFDQWVMFGTSLLLLFFLYTQTRITRLEGAFLLIMYATYLWLSFTIIL